MYTFTIRSVLRVRAFSVCINFGTISTENWHPTLADWEFFVRPRTFLYNNLQRRKVARSVLQLHVDTRQLTVPVYLVLLTAFATYPTRQLPKPNYLGASPCPRADSRGTQFPMFWQRARTRTQATGQDVRIRKAPSSNI